MNKKILLGIVLLSLTGCNPFGARENQTIDFISKADSKAKKITKGYKSEPRLVKPYVVYEYQVDLSDPFRLREFLLKEQENEINNQQATKIKKECLPPECVPPIAHEPELLESYSLTEIKFVGTLGDNLNGLVQVPDYGVVKVKLGDYVGKNNGKIQTINESSIILQEKIERNGLWINKKTILPIDR